MITLLENALANADGSYLTAQDLQSLDQVIQSWSIRRQTYDLLQAKENQILDQSESYLSSLMIDTSRLDSTAIHKCRHDMAVVLRSCATAMLLQDEELLKDRFLYWMQNIMHALQKQQINAIVYQSLQQAVGSHLPTQNAALLMPYLQLVREWLS